MGEVEGRREVLPFQVERACAVSSSAAITPTCVQRALRCNIRDIKTECIAL